MSHNDAETQPVATAEPAPCPACGYDLSGRDSRICPECGGDVAVEADRLPRTDGWWAAALAGAAAGLFPAMTTIAEWAVFWFGRGNTIGAIPGFGWIILIAYLSPIPLFLSLVFGKRWCANRRKSLKAGGAVTMWMLAVALWLWANSWVITI